MAARKQETRLVMTADNRTARAFREVQGSAKKTANDLGAMALKMAGVAAVGAAAAAALFLVTKRALDNASALQATADKIGLGVESLQELREGAINTEVATATLDMAMQRFSRRVGEAVKGQGELKDTLKQYGIEVTDAEGRTRALDDVLDDYADAIMNADSAQEQLRLSFKGFDSEGAALVNMLRRGSGGLDEMREEARRLGLVLDEDMVRQADAANDSMERLNRIVGVNTQRVLIAMAPLIESFGTAFADAAPDILSAANALIRFIGGPALLGISALNEEIGELQEKIAGWREAQEGLFFGAREFIGFEVEIKLARDKIAELEEFAKEKQALIDSIARLGTVGGAAANDNAIAATIDNERKRAEALLLAINDTNLQVLGANELLLEQKHEQELAALFELYQKFPELEDEFRAASLASQETFDQRKLELLDSRLAEENELRELYRRQDLDAERAKTDAELKARRGLHAGLAAIAALQNVQSRKAFAIGKAAAASLALVKTYEGAQNVFASAASWGPAGWILAPIAAAAAVVTGLANVQSILSTSYGSTSTGGRAGGGGGVSLPSVPVPDVPALAPPANDTRVAPTIFVNLDSDSGIVTTEWIRDVLLPGLNEAVGDGANIVAA